MVACELAKRPRVGPRLLDAKPLMNCCEINASNATVSRLSDLLTVRQLSRLAYALEVWRPLGVRDALRLWLPAPPGRARTIYLERSGRYTERDVTLLELLRPQLLRLQLVRDARRSAYRSLGLTDRQGEVLALAAAGRTNAEIALLLHVSRHPVRTHLANVFERLGVKTRTAAAARLSAAGGITDGLPE